MACVVFANLCRVLRRSYLIGEQDQRLRRGLCPSCGYDLRGNVSGVCPDCGSGR
jgi:hypothetical protein